MCSREVNLTEEEKDTLKAEGLPIPTTLPLTKVAACCVVLHTCVCIGNTNKWIYMLCITIL